jgi:cytochrome P450
MSLAEPVEPRASLPLPPRPARAPSTWQLFRAARSNSLAAWDVEMFDELFVERSYFWGRLVVVSDPDGVRRVLQDNYDNYPRLASIRRMFEFGAGTGIFCVEGDAWRRHRRLLNRTLDARALSDDLPLLVEITAEMVRRLAELPPGQEIDIGEALSHLVKVSTRLVFATDDRDIEPMLDTVAHYPLEPSLLHFAPLPEWLPFAGRYRTSRALADGFRPMLDRLIAKRRPADYPGRRDLVWRLVHARERADSGDEGLNDSELRDEIITLAATAYTILRPLTWVWYLLALHPWAERRLHAELDAVLGEGPPTAEDLPKLVYLRRLLDETMRLYPPLPVMILRTAAADDMVCGRRVARRSTVAIAPWILHRHRKLWHQPDRFDPERFAPQQAAGRSRYAYLPFGIGPHICIGAQLATTQMVLAVAMLAQRFRFRLVPGQHIEPTAWINLRPSRDIRMMLEPRIAAAAGRRTETAA